MFRAEHCVFVFLFCFCENSLKVKTWLEYIGLGVRFRLRLRVIILHCDGQRGTSDEKYYSFYEDSCIMTLRKV